MKPLKEILGDDLFNQVSTKISNFEVICLERGEKAFLHKEKEEVAIINNGSYVPVQKMNDLLDEKKQIKQNLDNLSTELNTLKNSTGDVNALKAQIQVATDKLTTAQTEYNNRVTEIRKSSAVKELLTKNSAKHVELLVSKVDLTKVELDDKGEIKEASKLINPLKEEYKDLFGVTKFKSSITSKDGTALKPDNFISKEEFLVMSEGDKRKNIQVINESSPHWND